jgi:hypothetical protein
MRSLGCLGPRGGVPGSESGARGPVAGISRLFPGGLIDVNLLYGYSWCQRSCFKDK